MELLTFDLGEASRPTDPTILLDSGPPSALYGVNPRLILGKDWWDRTRKKAYKDFMGCCAACGASRVILQGHEMYEVNKRKSEVYLKDVVPLCTDCHSFVHQDIHRSMLAHGEITTEEVRRILARGNAILKKAGIRCNRRNPNSKTIKNEDWRLVIGNFRYMADNKLSKED